MGCQHQCGFNADCRHPGQPLCSEEAPGTFALGSGWQTSARRTLPDSQGGKGEQTPMERKDLTHEGLWGWGEDQVGSHPLKAWLST